jgi:tRNA threonylcarbamoyl adenosine modification protein (Sua5/YciO/YrdC/YwlC family)
MRFPLLMKIYTKDEYELHKKRLAQDIQRGSIFIYPTDTIYGIGCNALDRDAVHKLRTIKDNHDRAFSIIVPSKGWILENCDVFGSGLEWIDRLPGPYTLIFNLTNKRAVARNVFMEDDTLGVRIPDHWCVELARLAKVPIITTSANRSGDDFMTSQETLNPEVSAHIDFMIDEGEIDGRPSTIVHLTEDEPKVVER